MIRLVVRYGFLALCVLTFPFCALAATKVKPGDVYSVSKSGAQFQCVKIKDRPLFVIKKGAKYTLGSDAVYALQLSMKKTGKIRNAKAKKKLKDLKRSVTTGNAACKNPDDDNNNGGGGGEEGGTTLEKLSRPLTRSDIAYLLDKAALGLSSREEYLVDIGLNQGIEALVEELTKTHAEPDGLLDRVLDWRDGYLNASTTQDTRGQRKGLLDLWINTNNPYQEKLALFLLTVWTCSGDVISDETFRGAWWDYYQRLRDFSYSNGTIPDLGVAITKDPLMLIYLNNELNVKGNPNENYARELMELFTLGPTDADGNANYTETAPDGSGDIAVAARMLTGFKVKLNYQTNTLDQEYQASRHQNGPHTMFSGKSYAFTGEGAEDLVRGIFANHPQARNYYAREILKIYLSPNPPQDLVESFGSVLHTHGYRLNEAMKILLQSEVFYNSVYRNTVTMNSFEYAAKTARMLEMFDAVNVSYADDQLTKMGIQINQPPSVFWYNPDVWSSSSVILEKANYLATIFEDSTAQNAAGWSPAKILPTGLISLDVLIDWARSRAGLAALSTKYHDSFTSYLSLQRQYNGVYTAFSYNNTNTSHQRSKGLGLYYLMMLTPEFNLL